MFYHTGITAKMPLIATQRVEQLKSQLADIRNTITGEVATAIGEAARKMHETISTQLAARSEVLSKKFTEDMNALSIRLESRITRSREN